MLRLSITYLIQECSDDTASSNIDHLENIICELKEKEYITDYYIIVITIKYKKKLKYKTRIADIFNGNV